MTPVVLVDGMNTAYRMHWPHRHLKNSDGFPTSVIYGVLKLVKDFRTTIGPDVKLVFVWEGGVIEPGSTPVLSWRKELFTAYKAQRKPSTELPLILQQLPVVQKALRTLCVPTAHIPGLEADDIIGVLATELAHTSKVYVYSSDRDFFQLLETNVTILRSEKGKMQEYTEKKLVKEFSVSAGDWAKYRALCGDATDNFKGAFRVGPVKACKFVNQGLDPSVKTFTDLPIGIQSEFAQFKDSWDAIHCCYILSYMPRSATYARLPKLLRKPLLDVVKNIASLLKVSVSKDRYEKILTAWTAVCADYELHSFLADRRAFLKHLEVY